ncbi:MAG TPA: TIGR03560 family F420-dependent LLM class oxidoreductase, partial [Actinomycetota bacterium]|nr:TIGR03560 family F420-dependent LLM class oxidoreductase [Actinomycetota bacterium]
MRIGIDCSQHQLTWDALVDRVQFAEDVGFDGAWVFDHFKPMYGDPTGPCLESWTLLSALGAVTSRIRLGALVTGVTYRHPSMLAMEAVTVDHVSSGRLELAVGAAWFEPEHRELGFDFPPPGQRGRRLEEAIEVMKLLMTEDGATFDGRYYRLQDAAYYPRPVQQPHPPLWIGAGGEKVMLPIVGRHADVWHGFGHVTELDRKWRIVAEHAEAAGRDPATIERSTSLSISESWDEVKATAAGLREAGIDYVIASWPAEGKARVEEFWAEVAP